MSDKDKEKHKKHDCQCDEKCQCEEKCEEKCECDDKCGCQEKEHKKHHEHIGKEQEYLALARQIQADFDNFRRHTQEDIQGAKFAGQASVIEAFLPCLDTFKEAKKSISDQNILTGIEMIENKIIQTLGSIGVQKVQTIGENYNPHIHEGIAFMCDKTKPSGVILDEYQAGYVFNNKVIRYAKVIVNKLD